MAGKSKIKIEKHLSIKELDEIISGLKIDVKVYQRAIFLKMVMQKKPISHAAEFVGVTRETGFNWLKKYNEKGFDGLIPKYGGGRPSFLTDEQFEELKEIIINSEKNYSICEVQKLIKDNYGVNYSYKQVWEISKKKLNLNYGKPFPIYDKKLDNAEEILKKTQTK
jgi:transposase